MKCKYWQNTSLLNAISKPGRFAEVQGSNAPGALRIGGSVSIPSTNNWMPHFQNLHYPIVSCTVVPPRPHCSHLSPEPPPAASSSKAHDHRCCPTLTTLATLLHPTLLLPCQSLCDKTSTNLHMAQRLIQVIIQVRARHLSPRTTYLSTRDPALRLPLPPVSTGLPKLGMF